MRRVVLLFLAVACPSVASGQVIAIASNLLNKVEDVGVYGITQVTRASRNHAQRGVGMEFSFGITDWRSNPCDGMAQGSGCRTADTTLKLAGIRRSVSGTDSTFEVSVKPLGTRIMTFSLTVASRLTTLYSDDAVSGWNLDGKVVEFPTMILYGALYPDNRFGVSPYLGVSVLPAELKNVRLTQGDSTATVEASTVDFGGSVGIVADVKDFQIFTELEYAGITFSTTGWKRPGNLPAASVPAQLSLKGLRWQFGVQVPLKVP